MNFRIEKYVPLRNIRKVLQVIEINQRKKNSINKKLMRKQRKTTAKWKSDKYIKNKS